MSDLHADGAFGLNYEVDLSNPQIRLLMAEIGKREAQLAEARAAERERIAKWHVERAEFCRHIAETTIRDWISPDNDPDDNRANRKNAREHQERARWHDSCAIQIRALRDPGN